MLVAVRADAVFLKGLELPVHFTVTEAMICKWTLNGRQVLQVHSKRGNDLNEVLQILPQSLHWPTVLLLLSWILIVPVMVRQLRFGLNAYGYSDQLNLLNDVLAILNHHDARYHVATQPSALSQLQGVQLPDDYSRQLIQI